MKNMKIKKKMAVGVSVALAVLALLGCSKTTESENPDDNVLSDNIIITETGDVLEKKESPTPETVSEPSPSPEIITPDVELVEPEQEQVITEEDQTHPQGAEMQLVFLGDSIFDNNRDGTGVPYLTAVQCEADVFNLAIGGTSATVEMYEDQNWENWTSRSLVGVVNAIMGRIPSNIFEGTRTKEILDNPDIDFSQTDYFIVEYGMNDFFRGVAQNNPDKYFDLTTYAGALRYAVDGLRSVAPDATVILCAPNYAQFYSGSWMIGDGNSVNNGNGTLFDYKGTCNYVANEKQTLFMDAYGGLGIDSYTADQYLEDGVHLTAEGRQLYADALAKMILKNEETKNN